MINLLTLSIDKVQLKCDCVNGSFVNGTENLFYTLLLGLRHPGLKNTMKLESNFLKR